MKSLEPILHAALLLVALGLAWSSWKDEEPETLSSVAVFEPGPQGLTRLEWDGDKNVATIEVSGKGDALQTWITAGRKEKLEPVSGPAAKPDDDDSAERENEEDAAAEEDSEAEYGEAELRSFPGNDQATKLVESFQPLEALRRFDSLDAAALEQMGLDKPNGVLKVVAAGKEAVFEVGDKAYGSNDTYLRPQGEPTVYLVSSKVLGPLRSATSRLMERNLFGYEEDEVESAVVESAAGGRAEFAQQGRHDKANAFWARPDDPETADTTAQAFMEKVFQLRATSYPLEAERPADGAVEVVLTVGTRPEGGEPGSLALGRMVDPERSSDDERVYDWFAKTHRTREQWVKVSKATAQDLYDSVGGIVGD